MSRDPSMFETITPEDGRRKESCEISFSECSEEPAEKVPKYPSTIKASMLYIKQTSRKF